MANLLMKVQYKNDLRRWTASPETLTIDSIERKIKDLYFRSAHVPFVTKYVDEDGDFITLETVDDLDECLSRANVNLLRLFVSALESGSDSSSCPDTAPSGESTPFDPESTLFGPKSTPMSTPPRENAAHEVTHSGYPAAQPHNRYSVSTILGQVFGATGQTQCFTNQTQTFANTASNFALHRAAAGNSRVRVPPLQKLVVALQASGINLDAVLSDADAQRFVNSVAAFAPRARQVLEGYEGTTQDALLSEFLAAVTPPGASLLGKGSEGVRQPVPCSGAVPLAPMLL